MDWFEVHSLLLHKNIANQVLNNRNENSMPKWSQVHCLHRHDCRVQKPHYHFIIQHKYTWKLWMKSTRSLEILAEVFTEEFCTLRGIWIVKKIELSMHKGSKTHIILLIFCYKKIKRRKFFQDSNHGSQIFWITNHSCPEIRQHGSRTHSIMKQDKILTYSSL